jgi:hypothetical protein
MIRLSNGVTLLVIAMLSGMTASARHNRISPCRRTPRLRATKISRNGRLQEKAPLRQMERAPAL